MNDWNYTKKGAKVGLLYGLSGVVYWYALGILILNSQAYATSSTLMTCGLILALIGYILYFPLLIIPLHFSGILIIIFGATFGFLLDLGAVKKREKSRTVNRGSRYRS